jgi:hypothetical protein
MNLQERISVLAELGDYMSGKEEQWQKAKEQAFIENRWFTPEFIDLAINNIKTEFLQKTALEGLAEKYRLPRNNTDPKKIGIIMAGNIPLVGFHDLLCVFLTGHYAVIKLSSKDQALLKHLIEKMKTQSHALDPFFTVQDIIKGCDAYIATGSNNSSRYFEYYFSKYPHIIRKNRTSVAILNGKETTNELIKLSDDIHQFFGLGCRNVTKLFVPAGYDFVPLLDALKKYSYLADHHKYKNNYDYNLAIHILNNRYFMSSSSMLLVEDQALFSRIGQLHFEYYTDKKTLKENLEKNNQIQALTGEGYLPFGVAQCPSLDTFADGINTIAFLKGISERSVVELRKP